MWALIFIFLTLLLNTSGAPSSICPKNCQCSLTDSLEVKTTCTSLEFLEKLRPKQIAQITELDLSNLSLKTITNKLKKLKGLRKLDLSNNLIDDLSHFPYLPKLTHLSLKANKLLTFNAQDLPQSIEDLDISANHISSLEDLTKLPKLSKIDLTDNYIDCDCAFVETRDILLENRVNFVESAKCFSPNNVNDVLLLRVYCVNNGVLYDDFDQVANDEPIEDEYILANDSSSHSDENSEGSGSDGSGDGELIIPDSSFKNCFYNCSTPPPFEPNESLPSVQLGEEFVKGAKGILGLTSEKPEENLPHQRVHVPKQVPSYDPENEPIHEEVDKKQVTDVFVKPPPKDGPKESSADGQGSDKLKTLVPEDLQIQTDGPKSANTTTYIVVGALLVVMVALIAYVAVRKRRNAPTQNDVFEKPPVEMKPLVSKPNGTDANIPEKVPLMNGQNGHTENGETTSNKIEPADDEQVEVRPKNDEDVLLTPETKRVTIQAKELSSPKSPVLVQRRLDDDGRMVVTTSSSENRN